MAAVLPVAVGGLSEVPGVGGRVAERLVEYFGSEEEALRALRGCRLGLLAEAVGRPLVARIVAGLHRLVSGRGPREVAATEDSWRLFVDARGVVGGRVVSGPGRDLLYCMQPLPPGGLRVVAGRQELVRRGVEAYRLLAGTGVLGELRRLLEGLAWPRPVRVSRVERVLVVLGDEEAYREARERLRGLLKDIVFVDDPREVEGVVGDRDAVVYDPYGLYVGRHPRVEELSVDLVAPEARIEFLRVNWRVVETIVSVYRLLGPSLLEKAAAVLGARAPLDALPRLAEASRLLRGGDLDPGVDGEYARLHSALERLDRVVEEAEESLANRIREELEKMELRIRASELLELISALREGGRASLPEELFEVFERAGEEAERLVAERLGLEDDEAALLTGAAPREPVEEPRLDRSRVEELRLYLLQKLAARRLVVMQGVAEKLAGLRKAVEEMVDLLALLDLAVGLGEQVASGRYCVPEVSAEYLGVGFVEGVEAVLAKAEEAGREVQRISYVVGSTPYRPPGTRGERVVLLTGANSGGKTTLLKTLAEVSLLAQAGLPVPAVRAWVGVFERVVFMPKPQGMSDAGALEQMLSQLSQLAVARGRRLVLVDELEAATEAGAAAKMIAALIEALARDEEAVAVVVSHLAREILENLDPSLRGSVRIDGIEARGLDENYNLIVDRAPRYNYLARSTPELVVARLLHRTREPEKRRFLEAILAKLRAQQA